MSNIETTKELLIEACLSIGVTPEELSQKLAKVFSSTGTEGKTIGFSDLCADHPAYKVPEGFVYWGMRPLKFGANDDDYGDVASWEGKGWKQGAWGDSKKTEIRCPQWLMGRTPQRHRIILESQAIRRYKSLVMPSVFDDFPDVPLTEDTKTNAGTPKACSTTSRTCH
jgi:hypothetical protein